ncbi:hypothetical protein FRC12_004683 [Ceratobasidium sp. 428]|nr:hypothetical protein FRC12_004683 [Ceratobasidium sp. 428]
MGSSDSESGSDSGRSASHKKDKSHKKEKKDKKGSGDEKKEKKEKKDKDKGDKDKKDKDKKDKDKDKKDKDKDEKKDKKDDKHKTESKPSSHIAHALSGMPIGGLAQEFLSGGGGSGHGLFREGPGGPGGPPTIPSNPPTGPGTGASGQRIPASTTEPFPAQAAGPAPPFVDSTGQPVYVGSALVDGSNVQPCRITPSGVFFAANGAEVPHNGRYDLLPLTDAMEWVPASGGAPPPGKRLVEGGIENGSPLYHAAARVNSVFVPGKAGPALGGALIPANGTANHFAQDYYVLSWKE